MTTITATAQFMRTDDGGIDVEEEEMGMDSDLDILRATISNRFVRQELSPPIGLRDAARHRLNLPLEEISDVLGKHFEEQRRSYLSGSGGG